MQDQPRQQCDIHENCTLHPEYRRHAFCVVPGCTHYAQHLKRVRCVHPQPPYADYQAHWTAALCDEHSQVTTADWTAHQTGERQ